MAGQEDRDDAAGAAPIAVFLLDDHEIVRRGVRDLLEAEPDITVVGEAGTASSALARIPALKPDVAILDVRLPDGDGVSVCREIRSRLPQVACLMLTSFGDDEALFNAVLAAVERGHARGIGLRAQADPRHRPGRRGPDGALGPVDAGCRRGQPADGPA